MKAARYGHIEVARYLIENGGDLAAVNHKGDPPLSFAAHDGRAAMVDFLLKNGADIHAKNRLGWNALMQAALGGHAAIIGHLIDGGANLDSAEEQEGATALMIAAAEGHLDAVQALVQAGAALDIEAKNGRTALTWAQGKGHKAVVAVLEKSGAQIIPSKRKARKKSRTKDPSHCAFCNKKVAPETAKDNYCPACKAVYCYTHYPWGPWRYVHTVSDTMHRSVICPRGHENSESD